MVTMHIFKNQRRPYKPEQMSLQFHDSGQYMENNVLTFNSEKIIMAIVRSFHQKTDRILTPNSSAMADATIW